MDTSAPIVFKTSDQKLVEVDDGFKSLSLMLSDLLTLGIEHTGPIDLPEVHSKVLEQINVFVKKLSDENPLKGQMPHGKFEDEVWTEFTTVNLRIFDEWLRDVSSDMLIRMANAGQYMQLKAVVHPSMAVLAERAKQLNTREELRQFLNEPDDLDIQMREQVEKLQKIRPDF